MANEFVWVHKRRETRAEGQSRAWIEWAVMGSGRSMLYSSSFAFLASRFFFFFAQLATLSVCVSSSASKRCCLPASWPCLLYPLAQLQMHLCFNSLSQACRCGREAEDLLLVLPSA